MAVRVPRNDGILEIRYTCTDADVPGVDDPVEFGFLYGRYQVYAWPNADQRLYRNGQAVFPTPGGIIDFGRKGSLVYVEQRNLLTDYSVIIGPEMSIGSGSYTRFEQWQLLSRGKTYSASNWVFTDPLRCMISGAVWLRVRSHGSGQVGGSLALCHVCETSSLYYPWPLYTWTTTLLTGHRERACFMLDDATNANRVKMVRVCRGDWIRLAVNVSTSEFNAVLDWDIGAGEG